MAAALFYSLVTVRVSHYARLVPLPVFGASKLTGLAVFAVAALGIKVANDAVSG